MKRVLITLPCCAMAAVVLTACGARPMPHTNWQVQFGPVLEDELVVGRASAGTDVWLATTKDVVIHVRLGDRTHQRHALRPRGASEHMWGLARADGRLWSLLDRRILAEIAPDGAIAQRIPLSAAHVGLYGGERELVYQVIDFNPPGDALATGPPGDGGRRPWGGLKTRAMPLDRAAAAALNLVSCGAGAAGDLPCWFPDEARLFVVSGDGRSRQLELEGLPLVPREVLLTAESSRKPIRDAFTTATGEVWVVGSGHPPAGTATDRPGGWLLASYTPDGHITRRLMLPEPARLVLHADADSCLLLSWNGHVVEVRP